MSGLFQADRLCPLGFSTGTAYIEMTLPAAATPFCKDANDVNAIAWSISNVELHVPVLRMSSDFNMSFRQLLSTGLPINWASQSFHNVQASVGSGSTGQTTLTMATRKRSVKSVISLFRASTELTNEKVDSISARKSLGISEYNYTVGGMRMPSKNVAVGATDLGEVYANLQGCMSNLGNVNSASGMNRDTFILASDVGTVASKVAYALDLEAYGHSDVQSGKNLSGQGLPLVFEASLGSGDANAAATLDVLQDCYLLHDVIYSLQSDGSLSSSS